MGCNTSKLAKAVYTQNEEGLANAEGQAETQTVADNDFHKFFPVLVREIENYNKRKPEIFRNLRTNPHKVQDEWFAAIETIMQNIDEELVQVIGDPWNFLKQQNDGYVARHTIVTVSLVFDDPTITSPNFFTPE